MSWQMPRGFHSQESEEAKERRKEVYRRNPPRRSPARVQQVVVIEAEDWKRIERVLNEARQFTRRSAEGEYRNDPLLLALHAGSITRVVCAMDGLCDDVACARWGRHPDHEVQEE